MNLIEVVGETSEFIEAWPSKPSNDDYFKAQQLALQLRLFLQSQLTSTPTACLTKSEKKLARGTVETASNALRQLETCIGMK